MRASTSRVKRLVVIGLGATILAVASLAVSVIVGVPGAREIAPPTAVAFAARGAHKVKAAYTDWKTQHDRYGGDRNVVISLGYRRGLSTEFTRASGTAKLDLIEGTVSLIVTGLPAGQAWDVWLVDNRPGQRQSIKPEPGDSMVRVGRLGSGDGPVTLDADLGRAAFKEFHVDLVVVTRAGGHPNNDGLLFGAPSLFQRLYTSRRSARLLRVGDFATRPGIGPARPWAALIGARAAEADNVIVNEDVVFNALVAAGANLFINQKFNGNGRTCASCHRAEQNFTLDVNFIASLPDDDALFVAEFTPALAFTPFGPKFEVPVLMRKHGLFVENVDGTGDLVNRFTMRGVPHTLGMRQSLTPANGDGTTQPPNQRTGWSGDGAPGGGTLRDFATGAVTQHFTKRLNRVPGVDFRLPTDAELDAMEAFQLSLGRQAELALPLALKDAHVARGQALFIASTGAGGGGCNACHRNAGANVAFGGGGNRNFNTGVENQRDRPQVLTLQALNLDLTPGLVSNILPRDGGFGQTPGEGPDGTGFGNSTFNTVSLVEAADTGPFFHDNSVATIEGAVEFYNSQEFADAQGVPRLNLAATQVEAIAAFLRVINSLENIREATELATAAKTVNAAARAELLKQAIAETTDALRVLEARHLHTAAMKALVKAIVHLGLGIAHGTTEINKGLTQLALARADMVQ